MCFTELNAIETVIEQANP